MKRILLLPLLLLTCIGAGAQCTASPSISPYPMYNYLLRTAISNNSAYGTSGTYGYNTSFINFGDGTSGSGGNGTVYKDYASPGVYTVGIRIKRIDSVTNAVLCTDTTTQVITVGYSPCGTTMNMTVGAGGVVTFTVNTPAGTTGMTYSFNYGDGTTGSSLTHTYTSNGYYTVTLTATGGGCTYTNSDQVHINNVTVNCSSLHAIFSITPSYNDAFFNNTSTYHVGLTRVMTYDYGDGTTGANNFHTYSSTGVYTVKLKVKWLDSASQTQVCQDSVTHTFTVSAILNNIYGDLIADSLSTTPDTFKVWLIRYDSLTNMLSAIDSTSISGWHHIPFSFYNVTAGNYLVKGAKMNQVVGALGVLPTYGDSSLYWNTANVIMHNGYIVSYPNIWMKHGMVTSGPGFVAGNVSLGANKGTNAGIEGMVVFLRDANDKAIASSYTNGNGDFSFSNVPEGTYSVYPENLNYATTPATSLLVSSGSTQVSGVNFNQDNNQMNIKPWNLSVSNPFETKNILSVFPNPATKNVTISWNGTNANGAHLIITNTAGQVVIDEVVANASVSNKKINIGQLAPGVYFLHGTAGLQGAVRKLIVE